MWQENSTLPEDCRFPCHIHLTHGNILSPSVSQKKIFGFLACMTLSWCLALAARERNAQCSCRLRHKSSQLKEDQREHYVVWIMADIFNLQRISLAQIRFCHRLCETVLKIWQFTPLQNSEVLFLISGLICVWIKIPFLCLGIIVWKYASEFEYVLFSRMVLNNSLLKCPWRLSCLLAVLKCTICLQSQPKLWDQKTLSFDAPADKSNPC